MEKRINCKHLETKHDSSESLETRARSNRVEESKKRKCTRQGTHASRRKKVASKVASNSHGWSAVKKDEKVVALDSVLDGGSTETAATEAATPLAAAAAVENDTKIFNRQVPDRLAKSIVIVSSDENDKSEEKSISPEMDFLLKDYSETKLYTLGNECLSNKEAVGFNTSLESNGKNIFENFFDDCLGSTSVLDKDVSSQDQVSDLVRGKEEDMFKYREISRREEKTPVSLGKSSPTDVRIDASPRRPKTSKSRSRESGDGMQRRHVCTYCQKMFKSNVKLRNHVYSHTGERPFDCNNCGKAFSSKFKLVRHLLIHSEVRKFICQICDRTFLRNDHLKNHYKVHDPQKKMYKCSKKGCAKEYSSLMSHKKHMAFHSVEDGDLKCFICNVKYETKQEILYHLKSHSGSRLFKTQSDKKFKCQFCDRLFLTRKDVTRHLVVHTGERDFLCQFCPQRFGRKDHLVRHINKSHVAVAGDDKTISGTGGTGALGTPVKNESIPDDNSTGLRLKKSTKKPRGTDTTAPEETEVPRFDSSLSQIREEELKDATRIVITVRGEIGARNTGKKGNGSSGKSNQQQGYRKSKNTATAATTQILVRNVPNIFIIPNNSSSIILVGNPAAPATSPAAANLEKRRTKKPEVDRDQPEQENLESSQSKFNYEYQDAAPATATADANVFHSSCQSATCSSSTSGHFPSDATDAFSNLSSADLTDFNPVQFEDDETEVPSLSLLNLMQPDIDSLPQRNEDNNNNNSSSDMVSGTINENVVLSEASRQIRLLETGMNRSICSSITFGESCSNKKMCIVKPMTATVKNTDTDQDLVVSASSSLALDDDDSLLNEFKAEVEEHEESGSGGILRLGTDCSILSSILEHQPVNELVVNESILRTFLSPENPCVFSSPSPLPGFNQIFHNSNANANSN